MKKSFVTLVFAAAMLLGSTSLAWAAPADWSAAGSLSLSAANVNSLATVGGTLYAGTNGDGVWAWDGSTWSRVGKLADDAAVVLGLCASGGRLYAGTYGDGVWAWDESAWSPVGNLADGAAVVFDLTVIGGRLHAATYSGVWEWDGSAWSRLGRNLPANVRSLAVLGATLYAGTYDDGVQGWDGAAWSPVGNLANDAAVVFSLTTAGGRLFAGTYGGVWVWSGSAWSPVGNLAGDAAEVRTLTAVNGRLYAGTNDGVWTWGRSAWSRVGNLPGEAGTVYALVTDGNTLYAGTYGGVWGRPTPPRLAAVTAAGAIPVLTARGDGFPLNQLVVSGTDQYGQPYNIAGMAVTWSVYAGNRFARVSRAVLSPLAAGTGTVEATVDGLSTNAVTFTVNATLSDIALSWAQADIEKLVSLRVATGYPPTTPGGPATFRPDSPVTRGEFVTMLARALNLTLPAGRYPPAAGPVFADTQGCWDAGYIAAAAADGLVSGYDASHFGPNDPLTREQMAAMAVRSLNTAAAGSPSFTDASRVDPWAAAYVATAVQDGIMTGYPDGSFRPLGHATRAEAAAVIARLLQ